MKSPAGPLCDVAGVRLSAMVALLMLALLTGCIDGGHRDDDVPKDLARDQAVTTLASNKCGPCLEATAAWDSTGRLFVVSNFAAAGDHGGFAVSTDKGRTFVPLEGPAEIRSTGNLTVPARADILLQVDPMDRLWWTAIQMEGGRPGAMQVARSDDGGATWPLNERVTLSPQGYAGSSDRPWLAFDDAGTVFLVCTCPANGIPQVAESGDSGASFSRSRPVYTAPVRAGPAGAPSWGAGTLLIPYVTGIQMAFPTFGVGVSATEDGGRTFREVALAPPGSTGVARFPNSAWQEGVFAVAWRQGVPDGSGGTLFTAAVGFSEDGGRTWSATQRWSAEEENVPNVHPWVEPLGGTRWAVVYFTSAGEGVGLKVASGGPDGPSAALEIGRVASGTTDFPHADLGPDGSLAIPWSGPNGLMVTIIPRAMLG